MAELIFGIEALALCCQEIPDFDARVADAMKDHKVEKAKVRPVGKEGAPEGQVNNPQGRNQHIQEDNHDNIRVIQAKPKTTEYGTSSSYLLRRLASQAPAHLTAYGQGQYKSVRQAAIAAGIVKLPTDAEQLAAHLDKAVKLAAKVGNVELSKTLQSLKEAL